MSTNTLLARYAEDLFWLARYMERAENLARILEVTEFFSRDKGAKNWLSVVQINADEEAFFEKCKKADGPSVLNFYLLDFDNPTSVASSIKAARENARALRPIISIEMWAQLNTFYSRMKELTPADLKADRLNPLLQEIKEECQAHAGIIEGTFYRDQAWYFYNMGKYLERADQTTRLLDIKYHSLLPRVEDVGSQVDLSQWNAVLRSAAGYQAYRRLYAGRMTPASVAGFLLFSDSFPRAVSLCVRQMEWYLGQVRTRYNLKGGSAALECLDDVRSALSDQNVDDVIRRGLHEFLDWLQRQFGQVTQEMAKGFF